MITSEVLRQLFYNLSPSGTRLVYVSKTGSDSNPGTSAAPYGSIVKALQVAQAGDQILIRGGIYDFVEVTGIAANSGAWITVAPATPNDVVQIHAAAATFNFFNIISSSYIGFYGLEVYGEQTAPDTDLNGISIYGNSHHIRIWNCHIHDVPGAGINAFDYTGGSHDLLDISFNTIHGTSKYSTFNTSGISAAAPRDLTSGTTWPDGHGYRFVGNYIYDCICLVNNTQQGFAWITDGNGLIADTFLDVHGYRKPVLIESNVITGCGGRGISCYGTTNADVFHNTLVGNLRTSSPELTNARDMDAAPGPNGQSTAEQATVVFRGNVVFPLHTPNWKTSTATYLNNVVLGGTQAVGTGGFDARGAGWDYFSGGVTPGSELVNTTPSRWALKNPQYVDKPPGVFGYGPDGMARP